MLKSSSSVSNRDKFAFAKAVRNFVSWILKLLKKLVVFDTPETPRLPVKPLLIPPVREAAFQIFIKVTLVLFAIVGPPPRVLSEIPLEADRVKVGVSRIILLLK